ncbi:hypothetical protein BpHYR1_000132 [Brachionus plicatilis]|uniref:Uncharacterized protein n=1 Tax=Brachionus plicatilis TaxID=10195 RepID=A0A3M7SD90_BRAPC|nr:hypothetical protein BpHYR1_000132 [Brachionus plicatilis]
MRLSILAPVASAILAMVASSMLLGSAEIVVLIRSSGGRFSGKYMARERISKDRGILQVQPLIKLIAQASFGQADSSHASVSTTLLQFFNGQVVDALFENHLIVCFQISYLESQLKAAISCCRLRFSSVSSFSNSDENRSIWSLLGCSPLERIFFMNSANSILSVFSFESPRNAVSSTVSCKNLAISNFALSLFLNFSCSTLFSLNVLGSMLGNSFKKMGKANSMKGTIIKMENGTSRNKSAEVRVN